jgi:hypothetical protein
MIVAISGGHTMTMTVCGWSPSSVIHKELKRSKDFNRKITFQKGYKSYTVEKYQSDVLKLSLKSR